MNLKDIPGSLMFPRLCKQFVNPFKRQLAFEYSISWLENLIEDTVRRNVPKAIFHAPSEVSTNLAWCVRKEHLGNSDVWQGLHVVQKLDAIVGLHQSIGVIWMSTCTLVDLAISSQLYNSQVSAISQQVLKLKVESDLRKTDTTTAITNRLEDWENKELQYYFVAAYQQL